MAAASILIVISDRKIQRVIQRILAGTGYPLAVVDSLGQAVERLAELEPVLVIVDGALLEAPGVAGFFPAATARGAAACMVLLGAGQVGEVPRVLSLAAATNLLVHPMPVLGEELTITVQKLLRGDVFGAEKYLLWGTTLHARWLTRAQDRATMVDQLASQLRSRGMSARVAAMAMLVTDELLSNAVHNAPIGADGVRYRADLPRDAAIDLDRRHQVRLRWGCDGRYLAIEVADRFGSLERDTVLQALTHNGAKDTGGGAGMGIALAYRSCDHLVFNLAPGMRTEVIALIDIRFPPGERVPASSYNVFVERNMTVETRGRTTMEAQGDVLVIRGAIDEAAGLPELLGRARNNQLVLDLGGVTFINSLGVRDWIRMQVAAQRTGIAIELRRLAEPIVHQMNMILATRGAKVVSFYAPYACNECGREESVLLDVAAHAPALARREAPAIACSECHTGMEFNDFPERYFSFIPV